ncbi:hypothetical protein Baya_0878 [Bagarius yarrelli]|uniref:Uncharacterized protein n=1 Tax=Bagarius yarrelli TaxID=175774 RepID=A0A556TJI9_BAGYA|nr:hypothetical protein Baya_0878 [Bagarius yarrelli]
MLKRPTEALGMTAHPFSFQSVCYDLLRMNEDPDAARRLKTQQDQDRDLQVSDLAVLYMHASRTVSNFWADCRKSYAFLLTQRCSLPVNDLDRGLLDRKLLLKTGNSDPVSDTV